MHPYTTDSSERKIVPLCIACVSILVAWALYWGLRAIQFTIPWWIDVPSVFGFYGLFYIFFDKYIWRWKLLRKIGIVKVPDLNGAWKGYIVSSFNKHAAKHDAVIKISQRWTLINIILETDYSRSHSLVAGIITENPTDVVLSYEYLNEPKTDAERKMHIHRGTSRLTINADGNTLEGEYYSGRDRQNFGMLKFERV